MLLCALSACSSSEENKPKDMTTPEISAEGIVAIPIDCEVFRRGDVIPFNYLFKDDVELGAYNIEIHNNFDHHTHSTEAETCPEEEHHSKEEGPDAWKYIKEFLVDGKDGEWWWAVLPDGSLDLTQPKAGFWKCPYHNTRMCLQVLNIFS